ncbi:unnamed protein product, partial [Didymodactylos carnosus]
RSQHLLNYFEKFQSIIENTKMTFEQYEIQNDRNKIETQVILDMIQSVESLKFECEQNLRSLESISSNISNYSSSRAKESVRSQMRSYKIRFNELNELANKVQIDLVTRVDPFLLNCSLMATKEFESITNKFYSTKKELEISLQQNEQYYERQHELDILMMELDQTLHHLEMNHEIFETNKIILLTPKMDKHREHIQSIHKFEKQLQNIHLKFNHAGLHGSLEQTVRKCLQYFTERLFILKEKSDRISDQIESLKYEYESLHVDMKKLNEWLKQTEQYTKSLTILNTANDNNEAAKLLLECYEHLNQSSHMHADYNQRIQRIFEALSNFQTIFYKIKQHKTTDFNIIVNDLQSLKNVRNEFIDQMEKIIHLGEKIIVETSTQGVEHIKLKSRQLQDKWRTMNDEYQLFE